VTEEQYKAARQRGRDEDLRAVLSTGEGRRLFYRLVFDTAGVMEPTFTGEAMGASWKDGKRAVGLFLVAEAQRVDSRLYLLMLQEAIAEQEHEARVLAAAAAQLEEDE
jgi:hypothetical protein